jgi:hypothetical protein
MAYYHSPGEIEQIFGGLEQSSRFISSSDKGTAGSNFGVARHGQQKRPKEKALQAGTRRNP